MSPLPEAYAGADRMAGARTRCAARRSHRHRLQPSSGARIECARRRNYRLWQGRGAGGTAAQVLREFLEGAGLLNAPRERMPGDASTRSYARLIGSDGTSILMNSPRRPDGPPIYDGKSYSAAVHLAEDVKPFVAIDNGLRAPRLLGARDPSRRSRYRFPDHRGFRQRRHHRRRSAAADRRSL